LRQKFLHCLALGKFRRQRYQCLKHSLIGRTALCQTLADCSQNIDRLTEQIGRLGIREHREKLEEERDEVRQFRRIDLEAVLRVMILQVHHRLPAVAALAVNVLEDVQRERPCAIEQIGIVFLQFVEIAFIQILHKQIELSSRAIGKNLAAFDDAGDFRHRFLEFASGICEQRGKRLEHIHHATSIGVFARFFAPNRSTSFDPVEQPLPKEKPQAPRMS